MRTLAFGLWTVVVCALVGAGCTPHTDNDGHSTPTPNPTATPGEETDPFAGLPTGEDQRLALCAKGFGDPVAMAFCGTQAPAVGSIADVLNLVGLSFQPGVTDNAANGNPGYILNVHSTGISSRYVSELNPRAIVFTPANGTPLQPGDTPQPNTQFVAVSSVRGERFIEMVAKDPTAGGALHFYLLVTSHDCEGDRAGCSYGEMLTESWENTITGYTLYDDDTIGNTIFDCKQCHQPDGPGTPKILRMQERRAYWSHWLFPETPQAINSETFFLNAHDQESYGGIPWPNLATARQGAPRLEALVEHNGFSAQPNEYDSIQIDNEVANNGSSSTWDALYAQTVAGLAIPVPYFEHSVADPAKLSAMDAAYQDVKNAAMPIASLPDIRDVHDDAFKPYMSLQPAPGLSGREILEHVCQHCHNSQLDQTITRANFNVELLDSLPREVKDEAIRRLNLADGYAQKMPPPRFHTLSQAEIDLVVTELSQ